MSRWSVLVLSQHSFVTNLCTISDDYAILIHQRQRYYLFSIRGHWHTNKLINAAFWSSAKDGDKVDAPERDTVDQMRITKILERDLAVRDSSATDSFTVFDLRNPTVRSNPPRESVKVLIKNSEEQFIKSRLYAKLSKIRILYLDDNDRVREIVTQDGTFPLFLLVLSRQGDLSYCDP